MYKLKCLIVCIILSLSVSTARADVEWGGMLVESFEFLGSDLENVKRKTSGYNADSWYRTSVLDVTGIGMGACAVPLSGLATLPVEFLYLIEASEDYYQQRARVRKARYAP